jgi:hypothetical protein
MRVVALVCYFDLRMNQDHEVEGRVAPKHWAMLQSCPLWERDGRR